VRKPKLRAIKGSGNVFADLGLPNPEQTLLKARLTVQIYKIVKERGLIPAALDDDSPTSSWPGLSRPSTSLTSLGL